MSWCGGGEIRVTPGVEQRSAAISTVTLCPQLAALTRLCALRHLDLQNVGIDQVMGAHPKPAGGNLFDP